MYVVSARCGWDDNNKPGMSYISYTRIKSGNIQIKDGSAMSYVCQNRQRSVNYGWKLPSQSKANDRGTA
ncbi:Uncharacterised protein [Enterocloster clostridioformis]|uniref:Uncharacterized protein n=1 Tax=Enterocloster clostridioformis TaxID=1531 RepID=A0A2X2UNQ0_9FIRM|nr:Uncharacterised protein [Enterocloster clostridioformis]